MHWIFNPLQFGITQLTKGQITSVTLSSFRSDQRLETSARYRGNSTIINSFGTEFVFHLPTYAVPQPLKKILVNPCFPLDAIIQFYKRQPFSQVSYDPRSYERNLCNCV